MQDVIFDYKKPDGEEKMALLSEVTGIKRDLQTLRARDMHCMCTDLHSKPRSAASIPTTAKNRSFLHLFFNVVVFSTMPHCIIAVSQKPAVPTNTSVHTQRQSFPTPLFEQELLTELCFSQQQSPYNGLTAGRTL